jgi:hypothetical protein
LVCHLQIDVDEDPNPAYDFDADPDPAYHFDADPDPQHWSIKLEENMPPYLSQGRGKYWDPSKFSK